ncbi:Outer membrane protein assembly factor BamA [Tepidimonas alkaliphilus]|uniref:Outer membrane protein assembly factor BamA n=1 Tax=Tepidimonas alkaliphilus TaxID=2588942 RepID=A0A554WA82_9BURK|nr:Outer membrane protein assembly factor BamA [Tepidimonas alkaliphilus]
MASLPFRIGDRYTDEQGAAAIRALFALGLFSDVRLQVEGDVLVVIVEERPTVADVSFSGVKEFDNEVLRKALRDIGLSEGRPFDRALADRAEQELKRQYLNRSMYAVQVTTTVTPIERNRVNINFNVVEGDVTKIREIRIVGAQAFSEKTLLDLFDLDTGGWLSWYTKSDRYSRAKLNADLETLRSYYLTRGYLEFRIDSTQVALSPDKASLSLTIHITEGQRFVVSAVRLEGDYLGREDEFKSLVRIRAGQPYNADEVEQTVKAFTDYFGQFGYAFARVEAVPELDRERGLVTLTLRSEPSRRAYVRRIQIEGNHRTRDEVIRREFRQLESAWYDGDKIRLSRDRVDRLGFFTEVAVETQEVPGAPDQVDLIVKVTEKPTGNLTLGAGYSQAEKLSLLAGIQQDNVFGTGNYLGLNLNTSKYNRQLVLSTTNPYFTDDGISRSFDLYYRTTRPFNAQDGDYRLVTPGVAIRFGVPFTEVDTVYFGLGVEQTKIEPGNRMPTAYNDFIARFGDAPVSVPLTVGWARDERDSALVPTQGILRRVNGELGIAGDTRYVKANAQHQQYLPLNKKFTLAFNAELGWAKGLGGKPVPLFKHFYGGGLGSVRGFEQGTLGATSDIVGTSDKAYLGGTKMAVLNTELIAPFPGAGNDRTLRMFGFVDIGNVFAPDQKLKVADLRASVGVGISWISPVGPLRIALAKPVRKQPGDRTQTVQFSIGTAF